MENRTQQSFSDMKVFTLQSWTLSDEQDRDLAATAPSSCSPPLPSGSLNIPSTPVHSTTKKK